MNQLVVAPPKESKLLQVSSNIWFAVIVIGQFIFALYILGLYGVNGIAGDFERWNTATPHGYTQGDFIGNIFFAMHVAFAAIITVGGPLQLIKSLRNRYAKFHRINGRIYIYAAFLIGLAGFYLTWVRGSVGGITGAILISTNGIIIFVCAFLAMQKAINRQIEAHRKWAIRLFLAMSGVWFFRVSLMLWLTIHQAPVGFDPETFQGPALNMLYVVSYILPIAFFEFYSLSKKSKKPSLQLMTSIFLLIITAGIAVGTFSATMGLWLPNF